MTNTPPDAIGPGPQSREGLAAAMELAGFELRTLSPEQVPLFPEGEFIIPETLRTMRKAVAAIHVTPAKVGHAQGLNSRRLMDACILVAQIEFRKRGQAYLERVLNERLSPIFEVRITDLARLAGIPGKNYQRIYEELDELTEMKLKWNLVGEDATVEWEMKSQLLSLLAIGMGTKRGLVRFAMDPAVLGMVLEPSIWAGLSVQVMEGLLTGPSYALYQNAFRYVNTNAKVTAPLPTVTWIELLIGSSGYVEDDPKEGKRVVRYADFKRRILLDSIRRVNSIPALAYELELKEIKSGTRVTKLQFKFVPKKTLSLGIPMNWPTDVVDVLKSMAFTEKEIEDLAQSRSFEEVADSLVKLKQAEERLRSGGKGLYSRKAYFFGILSNVAAGANLDDMDSERIEAEARAQEAQRTAAARQERLKEEFARHSATRFVTEFFELAQDEQTALTDAFAASPEGKRSSTFIEKGWSPKATPALAMLRAWMVKERVDALEKLLPNPEDRAFDAWLAWRADQAAT